MSTIADKLAGKIIAALADQNSVLAGELDGDDDAMDELYRKLFSVMLSPDWPLGVEAAIDGALLGRYYERYADHAVNFGRRIVYLVTGKRRYVIRDRACLHRPGGWALELAAPRRPALPQVIRTCPTRHSGPPGG